ncbi:peptidylprolyl isomerase [Rhodoferax sp.]|uniref:peptidylprolyl isomerase n=1 Tax=Rhodoferax sp. TaxID=50421 RepID=UPI00275C6120|nr:peptidylprolyl isomerase [Rhodoferax sp.]
MNQLSATALLAVALVGAGNSLADNTAPPKPVPAAAQSTVFARVGDTVITVDEYNLAFGVATRGKFYHGKPPEAEIAVLQREVSDQMVSRILQLREAKRRGLRADATAIAKTVQTYDQRYASSEQWKNNRSQLLPPLVARLEEEDTLSQLDKSVRAGVQPDEQQVRAYYAANQAQFTEPEQQHVAVILLKVEPSASSATWQKADEQAKAIAKRARAGEDFAALARQYSADPSAKQGGDMGYLHAGMLPDGAQEALTKLKPAEIGDSVRLLEGYAVFRLVERKAAKLHGFDAVKVRAQELAQRELGNRAWAAFIADLKAKTTVQIDQSRFLPLAK